MTQEPQPIGTLDPNEILTKVLEEFNKQSQLLQVAINENKALKDQIAVITQKVNEELPNKIKEEVLELANASQGAFKQIGDVLQNMQQQTQQATQAATPRQNPIVDLISSLVNRITAAPQQPASELGAYDKDINLMGRQLIKMTYQKALKDFGKSAGITIPELPEHIIVES